jgi:hypothetical protein
MRSGTFCAATVILVVLHAFLSDRASAAIELEFASLPSSQGWSYEPIGHPGLPEGDVFSVDGVKLTMDTIGVGFGGAIPQSIRYARYGEVDTGLSAKLEWTSRTLATEQDGDNAGGFAFGIESGTAQFFVGFRTDRLRAIDGISAVDHFFDATVCHTFRMETDFSTNTYDVFVDGLLVLSDLDALPSANPNGLFFGDSSNSANALAEISELRFTQPIPEPSVASGVLLWGVLVARRRPPRSAGG